jgi:hypothetical protein
MKPGWLGLYIEDQKLESVLIQNVTNDRWKEVICFYAALDSATNLVNAALDQVEIVPSEKKSDLLKLANRLRAEGRRLKQETSDRLDTVLSHAKIERSLTAEVRLQQQFKSAIRLNDQTVISQHYISWAEYQLFLNAQQAGQFHSQANLIEISATQFDEPVTGISWEDARWFCAWLSTQTSLQDGKVYDYRLPTIYELQQAPTQDNLMAWTEDRDRAGSALRMVRVMLPNRYKSLLNYLACGRWKDADRETHRLMVEIAGQTERGHLSPAEIQNFSCEDLRIIDQLWMKFSNGLFGFSIQKQIYVETGNPLDGRYHEESFERFCDRVLWRKNNQYVKYPENVDFDASAPRGHLPVCWIVGGWGVGEWVGFGLGELFSLTEICEL